MAWKRCIIVFFAISCLIVAPVLSEEESSDDDTEEIKGTGDVPEEDDVLILNDDNFNDVVSSHSLILVEFYAPWCGHCKQLAPIYSRAAKTLKGKPTPVPLAKIDATTSTKVAERYQIQGYPTLKYFKDGKDYDYDGTRDEDGIVNLMLQLADPNWRPPPSVVIKLTKDNFTEFVEREPLSLVEFYAPWCGHCKALAPKYEKAAKQLKASPVPIPLAAIDATVNHEVAAKYNVTGYPTLKVFRNGRVSDYKGEREEWSIVQYMQGQVGEAARHFPTPQTLADLRKVDDITVVGFFDSEDDPKLRIYRDAANDLRDNFQFAYTLSPESRKVIDVNPGTVVVFTPERFYTKHEKKWHVLEGDYTAEEVKDFVFKHQMPLVGEYRDQTEKRYDTLRPLCFVFYSVDWSFNHKDATQLWRHKIANVAKDFPDITFAIANEDDFPSQLTAFGLDTSPEELNIGILGKDNKRYPMEPMEEFDADEVRSFIKKFKAGKIKPHIKSLPVPQKQGIVKTVVGSTFEKIVLNPQDDVLIEFYAPWCGHCKKLEPVYKEVATKYKGVKNLVIAKIDATANDIPDEFEVKGFPTIYLVVGGKTPPIPMDGARDVDGISEFLEKHSRAFKKSSKEEL